MIFFRGIGLCVLVVTFFAQTVVPFNVGAWTPAANTFSSQSCSQAANLRMRPYVRAHPQRRKPLWLATSNLEAKDAGAGRTEDVELREGSFVVDGFRCYYCVATPPDESVDAGIDPVVFVHGAASNSAHFQRNLKPLAAELRSPVYAIDLLGYGKSSKPPGVLYGQELWAWEISTFLSEVVTSTPAFLVGHGLGAYACMEAAATNPEGVAGLAVMAPSARYGVLNPSGLDAFWLRWGFVAQQLGEQLLRKFSGPAAVRETLQSRYADPTKVDESVVAALAEPWVDPRAAAAGKFVFASLYTADAGPTWEDLISEEEVGYCGPLLAVWGDKDEENLVDDLQVLRGLQPKMQQTVVDAGHYPFHEKAEEVNQALASWVRTHSGKGTDFPIPYRARYQRLPLDWNTLKRLL